MSLFFFKQKTAYDITLIPMLPAGGFGCPCHGGQYNSEGNRTAGPPVRALDRYGYSIIGGPPGPRQNHNGSPGGGGGGKAENHKERPPRARDPLDGVEALLY